MLKPKNEEQETATEEASVYDLIERSGIRRVDISNRFDDVVQVCKEYISLYRMKKGVKT